jgi:hypothetical protein
MAAEMAISLKVSALSQQLTLKVAGKKPSTLCASTKGAQRWKNHPITMNND